MPDSASNQLIEHVCRVLDLDAGSLFDATSTPGGGLAPEQWRTHGDWLLLANRMCAERVFFVGSDPVIVFTTVASDATEAELVAAYRSAWSLSRPRCLFLARGGELRVYALTAPPTMDDEGTTCVTPIEIVERAADVQTKLSRFQRDRVEAGVAFEAKEFRSAGGRADHRLIADVTAATDALSDAGLDQATAHTLIERVILVRYLEDRKIIVRDYLEAVAAKDARWAALLATPSAVPNFGADSTFVRCLADADLSYAVFDQLAKDFNGDLFIADSSEKAHVKTKHLLLVKSLLEGTVATGQKPLFLWAYDFGVVPTSLISTMYEVFYQQDVVSKLTGTHYTPSELVEFTLAQTLTDSALRQQPKVCDPACGSGIFLVEAFRMIVRFESAKLERRLTADELRAILLDRIAGIDLNEEAVRLAAFSLYLAYLDYQTPQDIREAGPLPRLICRGVDDKRVLVVSDAFAPTLDEECETDAPRLPWPSGAFDVLIGNPPWTEPKASERGLPDEWGNRNGLEVGDRNRSQLFLWRALDLLNRDGIGAMLVAASAFVNKRHTSRAFRQAWLRQVDVSHIVNFAQVRGLFFTQAVAPFFLISFSPRSDARGQVPVVYETAVPSPAFRRTRSMAFARLERRVVPQASLEAHDHLWKVYAWGSHRDEALLARLGIEKRLKDLFPAAGPQPGYGYQRGTDEPSETLKSVPSLKTFTPWGPLEPTDFEPKPTGTKRQPDERLYGGQRVLVRRGVSKAFGPYARLVDEPLSFRHQIYCLPMPDGEPWKARVVTGTLLSSLGRYYQFMTSSAWGFWYDQVYLNEVLDVPVRMRGNAPATSRVVAAVDRLRALPEKPTDEHFAMPKIDPAALTDALLELDSAVFDLFELSSDERDVVTDFWTRFAEKNKPSALVVSPTRWGVDPPGDDDVISRYLRTFLGQWNGLLRDREARLDWRLIRDPNVPVAAAVFRVIPSGQDDVTTKVQDTAERWRDALLRYSAADAQRQGDERLYREGLLRSVSDDGIVIVKRAEARLWSRSAAREDAEATVLQAMRLGTR
ncbi:HsdM family class I SAM-dependent methyltransferase [Baekduia sp. Peel2402]|uniref:HsdM family class I SAM-dependent methyltransferase n=1 Tax=Baekduia sp. Peel2402 TaxID=3458296 RepID=UPI00403EE85A